MPLKGVNEPPKFLRDPLNLRASSSFRSSWTTPEGAAGTVIFESRIVNINLPNWTVDCITIFDQRRFFDIQVAGPYLHANRGEGIYAVPDVGAKCLVCCPSDGPPPFVLAYIMPPEAVPFTEDELASPGGAKALQKGSTYAGGRSRPKPGDIVLKGRDGNFCILHRGGVLQFGASELSQRICIPLGNLMTDISQNYNHFNTGGSINWGVVQGSPDTNAETEYKHTFRVFANDKYADVRASFGKIHEPVPEPVGDDGESSSVHQLGIGQDDPITFEFVMAPGGFETNNGTPVDNVRDLTKFKVAFDRAGNGLFRAEGNVAVRVKKKLKVTVDEDIEVVGKKNLSMSAEETMTIVGGKSLDIRTNDGSVRINGGTKPVATVGSIVNMPILIPLQIMTSVGPGTIIAGQTLSGQVSTGNPTIKV